VRRERLTRQDLGRAERAPACRLRDAAEALRALASRLLDRGLRPVLPHQSVDRLDDEEEENERDGHERDQRVEERAVQEVALVDREREPGEIRLAEDRRDQRRDQVGDECGDDCGEGHAEHECDGEVDEVAAKDELAKVLQLAPHAVSFRLVVDGGRDILRKTEALVDQTARLAAG
jgi:hypothetical protein